MCVCVRVCVGGGLNVCVRCRAWFVGWLCVWGGWCPSRRVSGCVGLLGGWFVACLSACLFLVFLFVALRVFVCLRSFRCLCSVGPRLVCVFTLRARACLRALYSFGVHAYDAQRGRRCGRYGSHVPHHGHRLCATFAQTFLPLMSNRMFPFEFNSVLVGAAAIGASTLRVCCLCWGFSQPCAVSF